MSTKPEKAAEQLYQAICSGNYSIGDRLPPERKLAEQFNCTQFTISKAISLLESRGLVEKKRGSGNYVKHIKSALTVAFLTTAHDNKINPVWHAVYNSLNVLTSSSNIHFMLCVIPRTSKELPKFVLETADIIIPALGLHAELIDKILLLNKPLIWLEEYDRSLPGATVSFDNYQAGSLAANHLYDLGCRNLVYITFENYIYPSQRRFEGFQKTLQEKDEFFNLITFNWFGQEEEAAKRLEALLAKANAIDGVFCFSDALVPRAIRAAFAADRDIPGELPIMGVDNSELSRLFLPAFTTIGQPANLIARKVHDVMANIISGNRDESTYYIDPKLIIRESTVKNSALQSLSSTASPEEIPSRITTPTAAVSSK